MSEIVIADDDLRTADESATTRRDCTPWRDKSTLDYYYRQKDLSLRETANVLGCSTTPIREWLQKHGMSTAVSDKDKPPHYRVGNQGYPRWETKTKDGRHNVSVHRLLAVCEFGFDAVCGKHVHHKNGHRWDNRPENLQLMSDSRHGKHHRPPVESSWRDVLRIREFYRNGDVTQADLAGMFGVSESLIYDIIHGNRGYSTPSLPDEFLGDAE